MSYHQITPEERYTLARLRRQGMSVRAMARILGRHPSSISRELRRNSARYDGHYRHSIAQERTNGRRARSRRNSQFTDEQWSLVFTLLAEKLSPEQISGRLAREGRLSISHETIYKRIWWDKRRGGQLHTHLRQRSKLRRKRYGTKESRGRLAGKRHITERPAAVESRRQIGHWEIDTVGTTKSTDCVVTLVERATGVTLIGKLRNRTTAELNRRVIALIRKHRNLFLSITADNGTEFHGYKRIERATSVPFYFATPYHSWERGTNENTNGLIRQYLPKRQTMHGITQARCNAIATALNDRPRKRHGFLTPAEKLQQKIKKPSSLNKSRVKRAKALRNALSSPDVSVAVQS